METAAESAAQQVASLVEHAGGGNDTGKTGNVDHSPIETTRLRARADCCQITPIRKFHQNFSTLSEFADL
jgi:hypothetical protein